MWPIFKKLWTKSVFEKLKFKCRFFLLGTFCPLGRFVLWGVLSLGRFVSGTFCPLGRFVLGTLCLRTFCLGTFCPLGRFVPWDVLSVHHVQYTHSWAQRKFSPLSPLNMLLSINGPLLSLRFNGFND